MNKTNRVKLLIHENYQNSFNTQNQVGIVFLEFIGNYVDEDELNNNSIDSMHYLIIKSMKKIMKVMMKKKKKIRNIKKKKKIRMKMI